MWIETDRLVDEMDDAKLREILALSDYYPPVVVQNAREELLKRESHPRSGKRRSEWHDAVAAILDGIQKRKAK